MWETLRATLYHNRRDVIMFVLLTIMGVAIFLPMMTRWQVMGDYTTHNRLAEQAINEPSEFFRNTPHFLYHVSVALMFKIIPNADINQAAAWTMTLCYIAMLWLIYWQLREQTELPPTITVLIIAGILTLSLSIIMPVNFFTPENLYFGYLVPHVYHNPTMIIMKPFSILLFFMALLLFFNNKVLSRLWILPFALVTGLSLVAKPSFIIAFVPTLGLITFFLMLRRIKDVPAILRQPMMIIRAFTFKNSEESEELPIMLRPTYINWSVLIIGIVLPTFLVLYYQTLTWTSSGGIGIDPFRVLFEWTLHYEDNADKQLFYKFIMSSAFPLLVYILHIGKTWRNFMLNTAWLFFFVSAFYMYFIVDYTVIAAGDFTWSAQIATLILFVTSTIFILKEYDKLLIGESISPLQWLILIACIVVFALHIVGGIHWYRLHTTQFMEELIYRWW